MRVINCFPFSFGRSRMEPAPAVQAYCYVHRLKMGFWVIFMVDTGAAGTCLHGAHAWIIQRYMRPSTLLPASGVGGSCDYYGEQATLIFRDTNGNWIPRTLKRIDIQQLKATDRLDVPSLLGRDILNRWGLLYDYSNGQMHMMVP